MVVVAAALMLLACDKQNSNEQGVKYDVNDLGSSLSVRSTTGRSVTGLGLFVENQTYPSNSVANVGLELSGSVFRPAEGAPTIKWGGTDARVAVTAYSPYTAQIHDNEIYVEMPQNQQNSAAVSDADVLWGHNPKVIFGQGAMFVEMKHIMSKLELQIKYVGEYTLAPENYTVEKCIVYGFYTATSFNPRTGEVSTQASLNREITASGSAMRHEAIMVPQKVDGLSRFVVSFVKEHLTGQTKIFSTKLNFPTGEQDLRSGHVYKAIIELGHAYDEHMRIRVGDISTRSEAISDVTVSDWNTGKVISMVGGDGSDSWLGPQGDRYGGIGTQSRPYTIRTAADFKEFATLINSGKNDFYARHIRLGADLRIDDADFEAAGTPANPFVGTFDGAGHKVTFVDYSIRSTDANRAQYMGLFGYCRNARLSNIVVGGQLSITAGLGYVGAVVAVGESTILENCRNMATITTHITAGAMLPSSVGGVAAGALELRNCSNLADITVVNDSDMKLRVAGVAGGVMVMQGCLNSGDIRATNNKNVEIRVAGILGEIEPSFSSRSIGLLNNGNILVDGEAIAAGAVANAPYTCVGVCSTASVGGSATIKVGLFGVDTQGTPYFRGCFFSSTLNVGLPAFAGAASVGVNAEAVSAMPTSTLWSDTAIDSFNDAIKRWNLENPALRCDNYFVIGAHGPVLR